jgi:hypothetical protein
MRDVQTHLARIREASRGIAETFLDDSKIYVGPLQLRSGTSQPSSERGFDGLAQGSNLSPQRFLRQLLMALIEWQDLLLEPFRPRNPNELAGRLPDEPAG